MTVHHLYKTVHEKYSMSAANDANPAVDDFAVQFELLACRLQHHACNPSMFMSHHPRFQTLASAFAFLAAICLGTDSCAAHRRPLALTAEESSLITAAPLPYSVAIDNGSVNSAAKAKILAKTLEASGAFRSTYLNGASPFQPDLIATPVDAYCNNAVIPIYTLLSLGVVPTTFDDRDCVSLKLQSTHQPPGTPALQIQFQYTVLGWYAVVLGFRPGWKHGSVRDDPLFLQRFRLQIIRNQARIRAAHTAVPYAK